MILGFDWSIVDDDRLIAVRYQENRPHFFLLVVLLNIMEVVYQYASDDHF